MRCDCPLPHGAISLFHTQNPQTADPTSKCPQKTLALITAPQFPTTATLSSFTPPSLLRSCLLLGETVPVQKRVTKGQAPSVQ
eukprot:8617110-Alexandrium_andersonii.AAC.1